MFKKKSKNTVNTSGGILLGKDNKGNPIYINENDRSNKNVMIFGASGSGKVRSYINPMIIERAKAEESMVIIDGKGDLVNRHANNLERIGYQVKIFTLEDLLNTEIQNLLGTANQEEGGGYLFSFSEIIMKNTKAEGKATPVENEEESSLLRSLTLYIGYSKHWDGKRTLGDLFDFISTETVENLKLMFDKSTLKDYFKYSNELFESESFSKPFHRLKARLQPYVTLGQIIKETGTPIDSLDCLLLPALNPCAYFIKPAYEDAQILAPLIISIIMRRLHQFADVQPDGKLPLKTFVVLDEFANIGHIPHVEKQLASLSEKGISTSIIIQSLSQLRHLYPLTWEEMMENCDTVLVLGCNDKITAEYFFEKTKNIIKGMPSTPFDIRCMNRENLLIFTTFMPTQMARKVELD